MKKIGIICEYNPFHNGHIYHLNKVKELFPDSLIILVMSGNFTMRGEISLLNKWDKAEISLKYGVDLVIELPTFYATNSADIFAHGAIKILKLLNCDFLVFGSESNDVNMLKKLAHIQINDLNYDSLVKKYMDDGNNYPTSMSKALKDLSLTTINLPNDLLGLSYVKEIMIQNANIEPITILRTNEYHNTINNEEITSATSIREAILKKRDITKNVPIETLNNIISKDFYPNLFQLLKYQIVTNINNLDDFLDVSEGLDNLIRKNIFTCHSYQELLQKIKTKRYTYNRLNRMFLHLLLNIKKKDVEAKKAINYIRVLGFNSKGKKYLKAIKGQTSIPIITKYSDITDNNLFYELQVASIYHTIMGKEELDLKERKSIPIQID